MNNFKKIGLTALGTTLIASSAFAADMSVSGGASISFDQTDDKKRWIKRIYGRQH